ncbi:MAG: 4-hydroxy-tetrahydrodipicolinate reductase [Burkholderiales bacterium]|nr:4-hydroxy-tetrahydrodipicolinate reductase [Burkholderiales bacterium]MCW5604696.1 4-hydroxy-tetrahydrodipicolinate reductase [Burkholderiales bacterium]
MSAANGRTRIAVAGSGGRMGRMLLETVAQDERAQLAAALEQAGNAQVGRDAGELAGAPRGVLISDDAERALAGCDVLIDFTRPEGTLRHLAICRRLKVRMVIGTTGFDEAGRQAIADAARDTGIVFAPNMSVGVNVTLKLLEMAAKAMGADHDIEIIEAHHKHKVDAPSGTALKMGEVVAGAMGRKLADCAVYAREGHTGERKPGSIGFATIRGGDIVGDHTVLFAGTGERVEITHRSNSRATYAQGAVRAAHFLMARPAGLYDMWDVLGLK